MTGISKITDKILADARAEAEQRLAAADAEAAKIDAEYAERAAKITERESAQAKEDAAELVARAKSGERTMRKEDLLSLKSEMIDRAFVIAENELIALPDDRRLELLTRLLSSALLAEYEAEQSRSEIYGDVGEADAIYEIMLNSKDKDKLGSALMENFRRSIVGKDMGDMPNRVTLSEDTVNIGTGVIIRVGAVEINCSVESIVASLRDSLQAKVEKVLFPQ